MINVEIWTNRPGAEPMVVEIWQLQNGVAVPIYVKGKEPMYPYLGDTAPAQGLDFLQKLVHVVNKSSYLKTEVYGYPTMTVKELKVELANQPDDLELIVEIRLDRNYAKMPCVLHTPLLKLEYFDVMNTLLLISSQSAKT